MNGDNSNPALDDLIVEYLRAAASGRAPDRESFIAAHPEHATELRQFFRNQDVDDPNATIAAAPHEGGASDFNTKVRYVGDYELLAELARGGMGVVYRARQVSLNRPVALKMILAGQFASPHDVQRFRDEAEAAANLDHLNIMPIYEVGEHEGHHYFSMKLVDHGSFARQPGMNIQARVAVLCKVARAVHFAHQRGILHRDLKPANVLLDLDGTPYVTDFGLAKRIDGDRGLTQSGAIVGTPSYMAPEQARSDKRLTTGVDVYAIGAMLYEALTGRPPFKAATPVETVLQVLEQEPAAPRSIDWRIDRDLETIALKCLEKNVDKRYASAAELADELDRWQRGEPILARATGGLERAWKWARRRPAYAWSLGTAITFVALTMAIGFTAYRKTSNALDQTNRHLYAADMQLAKQAWKSRNYWQLMEILDRYGPASSHSHLRGWEWSFFRGQCPLLQNIDNCDLKTWAWKPTGGQIAAARYDAKLMADRIVLINLDSGTQAELPSESRHVFKDLAWSPGGTQLASTDFGVGTIKIWNLDGDRPARAWTAHEFAKSANDGSVNCVAWSPEGTKLASCGNDKAVRIWDVQSAKMLMSQTYERPVYHLSWNSDGRYLALSDGQEIKAWDSDSGKTVMSGKALSYSWSPDGHELATGKDSGHISIIEVATGKELRGWQAEGRLTEMAWSPEGAFIASGTPDQYGGQDADTGLTHWNDQIRVWSSNTGAEIASKNLSKYGRYFVPRSRLWSADGKKIAAVKLPGRVNVQDLETGREYEFDAHRLLIESLRWSPAGTLLATGGQNEFGMRSLRIWDMADHAEHRTLRSPGKSVCDIAWNWDDKPVVSIDGTGLIVVSDARTGQSLRQMRHPREDNSPVDSRWQPTVSWAPSGQQFISTGNDIVLRVWNPSHEKPVKELRGHSARICMAAWSPNGERIVSASEDGTARIWNFSDGKEVKTLASQQRAIRHATWSPDGRRIATAGDDFTIKVWDLDLVQPSATIPVEERYGWILSLNWHPDGTRLVSGHSLQWITCWNARSGAEEFAIHGHTEHVVAANWSPDGKRLLSASADGSIKLWDVVTHREVMSFPISRAMSASWSPDGSRLGASSVNGTVQIWDAN